MVLLKSNKGAPRPSYYSGDQSVTIFQLGCIHFSNVEIKLQSAT